MATFTHSDDLKESTFIGADLRGARFVASDLSDIVLRGVEIGGAEIDSPWLLEGRRSLLVNGVDVIAYVDGELNRRFPGRAHRRATDPDDLRSAWAALESTWTTTVGRAAAMPEGTVDVSVGGEWSFAQTQRHLIHATDVWLGKAVLELDDPLHPIGLRDTDGDAGSDQSDLATPSYDEVQRVRAEHVALVRDFIADVTPEELATTRRNPHEPEYAETTLSCLHTILEEEWEHHRYAVRDLDAIEAG